MEEKRNLDAVGVGTLLVISVALAANHVLIKLVNTGIQPVFAVGLRSLGAALVVYLWMRYRGERVDYRKGTVVWGLLMGLIFSVEFLGLFLALDMSTVTRTSVIFYSMPVWTALIGHFILPGERLTPTKLAGLALAFAGVIWALADRGAGVEGQASFWGDAAALVAALGWTALALIARVTPANQLTPNMQIFWQVSVSGPVMLIAAFFFGPFLRDVTAWHWFGLGFQAVFIAAATFLVWFALLNKYKAQAISSFAFVTPVLSVAFGWLILNEPISASILLKLALVAGGIVLINITPRRRGPIPT